MKSSGKIVCKERADRTVDWRVLVGKETLSDHRAIMCVDEGVVALVCKLIWEGG